MRHHILLNIILAVIWCLLREKFDLPEFLIGALFGYGIIYMLRAMLDDGKETHPALKLHDYLSFAPKTARYIVILLKEVIKANINVVRIVLSPRLNITPGIFSYKLDVKTDAGITLLANSITLTPGTLTMDISNDKTTLYIHSLHMNDATKEERSIRDSLEKYSMEVFG